MRTPNFQILTGPTGSGKTHRLRALERAWELGAELGWAGRLGLAMRTAPDAGLVRGAVNQWLASTRPSMRVLE